MESVGELIRNYWPLVAGLGTLAGIGTFAWLATRFATKAEHRKLEQRLGLVEQAQASLVSQFASEEEHRKLEERMGSVEKVLAGLPTRQEWNQTDKNVVKACAQNEAIMTSLKSIENRLAMLYENELRQEQK